MERIGIHEKLIRLTQEACTNPQFHVEMEGRTSKWHRQHRGFRQGCPLSPYLFLIVMTLSLIHISEPTRPEPI
eukprot:6744962-Pyramimonas_sp.AAC.1